MIKFFSELQAVSMILTNKFVHFSGRARRREYWLSALLVGLLATILGIVALGLVAEGTVGGEALVVASIAGVILSIPMLAVTARRLHDVNRSGWWMLIAVVPFVGAILLLVWTLTPGATAPNRYGPDPRDEYDARVAAARSALGYDEV